MQNSPLLHSSLFNGIDITKFSLFSFIKMLMLQLLKFRSLIFGVVMTMHVILPVTGIAQLVNVAHGKTARQISTDTSWGGVASRAVDGSKAQTWGSNSCILTVYDMNPFWEMDLADVYVIDNIKIYNRLDDCCADRTRDVHTAVSVDGDVYTTVCVHDGIIPDIYTCVPETRTIARWVRITLMIRDVMEICEVEVMSRKKAGLFKSEQSVKGTGVSLYRNPVSFDIECANLCYGTTDCVSFNVLTGTNGIECELLDSFKNTTTIEENISFWRLY